MAEFGTKPSFPCDVSNGRFYRKWTVNFHPTRSAPCPRQRGVTQVRDCLPKVEIGGMIKPCACVMFDQIGVQLRCYSAAARFGLRPGRSAV